MSKLTMNLHHIQRHRKYQPTITVDKTDPIRKISAPFKALVYFLMNTVLITSCSLTAGKATVTNTAADKPLPAISTETPPTLTPTEEATSSPTVGLVLQPSATSTSSFTPQHTNTVTSTPPPCTGEDLVEFVEDVTYPDGAEVNSAEAFTKTWRLKNIGDCFWNTTYSLRLDEGNFPGLPLTVLFPGPVAPGGTIDISLSLTAPQNPGEYKGRWTLTNPAGERLGNDYFVWVDIVVP